MERANSVRKQQSRRPTYTSTNMKWQRRCTSQLECCTTKAASSSKTMRRGSIMVLSTTSRRRKNSQRKILFRSR